MAGAGWVLIIGGLTWIFAKLWMEWWAANKAGTQPEGRDVALPALGDLEKLLKAPYGPGVVIIMLGVILLLAANGVDVSFNTDTQPTPTPTPS